MTHNLSNIERNLELLQIISKCKNKYRNALIKMGDKELISAICECVDNMLQGNVKIDDNTKAILHKYRHTLRKIVQKSTLKSKKKILTQQGGFLPVLLPSILPTIVSSIAAIIASRNNK